MAWWTAIHAMIHIVLPRLLTLTLGEETLVVIRVRGGGATGCLGVVRERRD